MKSQVCFNADRVTVIYLTKETPSSYKFYPAEPSRQKYICRWLNQIYPFSAIPFGKTKAQPELWAQGDPRYDYKSNFNVVTDARYKVVGEGDNRLLYNKAKTLIYMGHNEHVMFYSDTNEEAETIVNNTKSLSKNPIQTVILD